MEKWKELGLKLLYPNIFIFVLFLIIGYGSVISVFELGLSNHWISYISYVLSAYALTITVPRCIKFIKWINKKLHSNKYTNRLLTDKDLKNNINLFSGTIFNMLYGLFKFIIGLIYTSLWSGATGGYYLILGIMKLSLTKHVIKKSDDEKQQVQYRNTGVLMFLLNAAMVVMIILMLRHNQRVEYPGFIIFAQAAYTFYILTFAIINAIKYRHNNKPLISASKAINLVGAIMSMFILQIAMVNEFGNMNDMKILNILSGAITSLATIGVAIYMLINSRNKTILLKITENDTEYLNLYDKTGKLLDEKGIRGKKTDKFEGIAIIFIENTQGKFLIQKTASSRNKVFATTGGHVSYGSTFFETIIKEAKEELGIDISNEKIKEVYTYIWDKYYQKVYYLKKDININDITIQEDEVEYVKWLTQEEIDELINNNEFRAGNIEGYKYIINQKNVFSLEIKRS